MVKDIVFPGILTAVSGLMAPRTTLQISEMEFEPVNLFTIGLAPPGAGTSSALHAGAVKPINRLEETTDKPIVVEDFTRSGVFVHLKATECLVCMRTGMAVFSLSQPDSFFKIYEKMSKNGSGL